MTSYGFTKLANLYDSRVAEAGTQQVFTAISESTAEYTRAINELLAEFAERTTIAQEQFELPGDGTLQPIDEDGNPLPVQPSGSYKVAYPIQGGATAFGGNRVTTKLLTVRETERFTLDAQQRDADWMWRHAIAAVLDNTTWTFNDKVGANGTKGLGDITIQPLANGDTVVYNRKNGVAAATDTHYLAQAAAISDAANPFPAIKTELHEHPSNGSGRILVYVAANLEASIRALSNFHPVDEPDVIPGSMSATVSNVPSYGPGDEVIGKVDGCWIILWGRLPDGYMIAKIEGRPILKMREYPEASLQGFYPELVNVDGNHMKTNMIRFAGFGVADRVGALVYQVGAAVYAIPTGYENPLPV